MKKIFKYSFLMLAAGVALVSCKDDDGYNPGPWNAAVGFADIYFPGTSDTQTLELDPKDPTQATITVGRRNTTGDLSVTFDQLVNTDDVFTVSPAVFADGDSLATMTVSFPNAEVGTTYRLQLTTTNTDYVSAYSDSLLYTLNVTRVKWNPAGYMIVTEDDLKWRAANDDEGKSFRPYYVEDEDGNVVPITNYHVGDTIKGWVRYTDDFVKTVFAVDNVVYPVKFQERDDQPGVYRLVNAYSSNYYYNYPGDWDDSKDYYMIIHMEEDEPVWMEYNSSEPSLGIVWSYGHMIIRSLSGQYYQAALNALEAGDQETAEEYYGYAEEYFGKYENGAVTFPAESFHFGMTGYSTGGFRWYGNGNGKFRVVIDPSKDLYIADIEKDYVYTNVFEGAFTSEKMGTTETVVLQKGEPSEALEALLEAKKASAPSETIYRLVEPYAEGYDIYFGVDEDGKVVVPDGYRLQPIGITDNMGNDIFAKIDPAESTFSEKEVVLNMSFVNEIETIDYSSALDEDGEEVFSTYDEIIANITWIPYSQGTYYYRFYSQNEDGSLEADPGYTMSYREDKPEICKIEHWGMDIDFMFTWNRETNACAVMEQAINDTYPGYGPIYVIEGADFDPGRYGENTSFFDPEQKVFHFFPVYFVNGGSFGQLSELFQLTDGEEETGKVKMAAPAWGNMKLNTSIRKYNKWSGRKVQRLERRDFRPTGETVFNLR